MAIEAVIEQALKLPPEERAEVAALLLDSLEEPMAEDPGYEAAWTAEIQRRVQDIREGRVEMIEGGEALQRARAAASRRR